LALTTRSEIAARAAHIGVAALVPPTFVQGAVVWYEL
jgi:hypothetical protein